MSAPDPIEAAIAGAAVRVLTRRADALRSRASTLITTVTDARGRPVQIVAPEARVMIETAQFFADCAADFGEGRAHG